MLEGDVKGYRGAGSKKAGKAKVDYVLKVRFPDDKK